jgi:diguanylate cyclase (GGDEF)-like protein
VRLRLLVIEDCEEDAQLELRELERAGLEVQARVVTRRRSLRDALRRHDWDIVLCDGAIPGLDSLAALALVREVHPSLPFVLVSGSVTEELVVGALRAGVNDFVSKDRLARLPRAVVRAMAEAAARRERDDALRQQRETDEQLRAVFEHAQEGMVLLDGDWRCMKANRAAATLLGRPAHQLAGDAMLQFAAAPSGSLEGMGEDGDRVVEFEVSDDVLPRQRLVVLRDVTARREADHELHLNARRQGALAEVAALGLSSAPISELLERAASLVHYAAPANTVRVAMAEPGRLRLEAHVGDDPLEVNQSEAFARLALHVDSPAVRMGLEIAPGAVGDVAAAPIRSDRARHGVMQAWRHGERGFTAQELEFIGAVADSVAAAIERRDSEEALRRRALQDPLTGLANRSLLYERLEHWSRRTARSGERAALLLIDLDHFKRINDSLGHRAGDDLIVQVATRLREAVRPADTVARIGGDEFVVLCEQVRDASDVAHVAHRLLEALEAPFALADEKVAVGASIGVALGFERRTPEEMLAEADVALYCAKDEGRARHVFYDRGMRERVRATLTLEQELREALEGAGGIFPVYQPILHATEGSLVGLEALARWNHPSGGIIPPGRFIPVAEQAGLIGPLGRTILDHACADLAGWGRAGATPPRLYVNVSPRELLLPGFARNVVETLARHEIPSERLCLEIVESVLLDDASAVADVIAVLHEHGLSIALDDFGTGSSSLSFLQRLPIDVIKLDRSYVAHVQHGRVERALVDATLSLAAGLDLGVIGEGVEELAQAENLVALGCELQQGFLYSRPLPADEVLVMLHERTHQLPRSS